MKRFITILLAVAGVALASTGHAVTSGVHGQPLRTGGVSPSVQPQINGGIDPADTTAYAIPLNTNGVITQAQFPIQDANQTFTTIIDDTTNYGMADSSAVLDVHKLGRMALMIRATVPDSFATPYIRLAIQVRSHLNGQDDSTSTFPWYGKNASTNLGASGLEDTLSFYPALMTPTAIAVGQGEFVVTLRKYAAIASKWSSQGNMAYVIINGGEAMNFWAPYMSVRVRVISQGAKSTAKTARITVHLVGTPL